MTRVRWVRIWPANLHPQLTHPVSSFLPFNAWHAGRNCIYTSRHKQRIALASTVMVPARTIPAPAPSIHSPRRPHCLPSTMAATDLSPARPLLMRLLPSRWRGAKEFVRCIRVTASVRLWGLKGHALHLLAPSHQQRGACVRCHCMPTGWVSRSPPSHCSPPPIHCAGSGGAQHRTGDGEKKGGIARLWFLTQGEVP